MLHVISGSSCCCTPVKMWSWTSAVVWTTLVYFLHVTTAQEVTLSEHPVLIVISYDGFRYDYLDNKTETPNLLAVKKAGVSVPYVDDQFLTYTFPNHHSIATGLYIESHGIVANAFYDPLYGKFLSGYTNEPGFWNYSSSVVPLWVLNEWRGDGRHSGVMMWPGSGEPWGENNTMSTYVKKYDHDYAFENRVDDVISWITNKEKPANLVFLYFEEPDKTGHDFGPEGQEITKTIKDMDNLTGYILQKLDSLNISDRVNLMFLSDHGMQEVKVQPEYVIKYESIVSSENKTRYLQYGSTPVLQLLPTNKEDTQAIYQGFRNASANQNFSAYLKEDLRVEKPHWHYSETRRVLPILLVADLGYLFEDYKRKDVSHSYGVHGYDNANMKMKPYFMARGPIFKGNGSRGEPFENIDIFPLVCELMGLPTPGHNGSIDHIRSILSESYMESIGQADESGLSVGAIIGIIAGVCILVAIVGVIVWRTYFVKRRGSVSMH